MSEDTRVHYGAKNTVFLDLFSIPEYRLQMFQALHPEMTDVTEDEIKPVTLNPVILNSQYNDLAFLVRDKLIIFVEAQSTWSINILVRILLYLAGTYQNYITDKNLNVYSSHPDAKVDLQARVINSESSDDIIGQYIIFCHVLDGQIKIHGRQKAAIEETIRICQNHSILKKYLEGRKKEVISMFDILFDPKYIKKVYGIERTRLGQIGATVEAYKELDIPFAETVQKLIAKFGLSEEEAREYADRFWDPAPNTDPYEEEDEGWVL